jgi:hypothetical protein
MLVRLSPSACLIALAVAVLARHLASIPVADER